MRAILLAAGLGTRLRPLTLTVPKCLVPIHQRPLLAYWFEHLFTGGIERILVNLHWLPEQVEAYIANSTWRNRVDTVFEPTLLGTGGTVLSNASWLNNETYLLAHADNLTDFDVAAMLRAHDNRPPDVALTMLAFRTDAPRTSGILELDACNIVQQFHEKVPNPPGDLANAAVYLCEPEVTTFVRSLDRPVVDFSTDVIPHFLGRILAFETTGYHRDIGSIESLARAEAEYPSR